MIIEDLVKAWSTSHMHPDNPLLIKHEKMRTVKYWPISLEQSPEFIVMDGYWISDQIKDVILREKIRIKTKDFGKWYICDEA